LYTDEECNSHPEIFCRIFSGLLVPWGTVKIPYLLTLALLLMGQNILKKKQKKCQAKISNQTFLFEGFSIKISFFSELFMIK
jgi:hypothetical protein